MNKLTFKKIDFWLQFILILICFSSSLFYFSISHLSEVSFASFFLIGFCQAISAIINFFRIKVNSKGRKLWQIISVLLLFLILIAFIFLNSSFNFVIYFLIFALFLSPILVIWYLVITWQELKELNKANKIE